MATTWHLDQIVSVIGGQLFTPIADLLDRMLSRPFQKSTAVSSNYYEGGYAVSLILLLAIAVESMVARDRYFNSDAKGREGMPVPEYMKKVLRFRSYARLSDLFVLRDAIAHNHIWTIDYSWTDTGRRKIHSASRTTWSGNKRLKERLNLKTLRTKRIKANVVPMRMERRDVYAAFTTALAALHFLEKRGANPVMVTNQQVRFKGERIPFAALRDRINDAL